MFQHPALEAFRFVEPRREGEFQINCIGARARSHYFPSDWFAITDALILNEELFEWIDVLDAVRTAGDRVTVVDFGAGYGRWLVNAVMAARQLGKDYLLGGVECEDTHFAWMQEHLRDNDVETDKALSFDHPISDEARQVFFTEGHAQEWYGQAVIDAKDAPFGNWPEAKAVEKTAAPAADVLARFDHIDSLHVDLQGEERRVVPAVMHLLNERVRRVHIGTHSPEIDTLVEGLFRSTGWTPRLLVPIGSRGFPTQFGAVDFNDGIQSWSNPRLER